MIPIYPCFGINYFKIALLQRFESQGRYTNYLTNRLFLERNHSRNKYKKHYQTTRLLNFQKEQTYEYQILSSLVVTDGRSTLLLAALAHLSPTYTGSCHVTTNADRGAGSLGKKIAGLVCYTTTLTNTIVSNNTESNCFVHQGTITGSNNLAENGGPMRRIELMPGSTAVDTCDDDVCPTTG